MSTDLLDTHVTDLAHRLRGPGRIRRSMLTETRDGLHDAAAAYRDGGLSAEEAAARAVADFGSVAELAPLYQEELTARQSRRTALALAVVFPAVVLGWDLLWKGGIAWQGPSVPLLTVLVHLQDAVSWGAGALGVVMLALSFHRRVPPRHLAVTTGLVGATGVLLAGGAAALMIFGFGPSNSDLVVTDPVAPVAYGCSAAALMVILWSVARTARVVASTRAAPG